MRLLNGDLFRGLLAELRKREIAENADELRARFGRRGGLLEFIRYFWPVIEPGRTLVEGWALEAICLHCEAVTFGHLRKVLMNVPPGFMKSLVLNVFWPAWEWGPMQMPWLRYLCFSYSPDLTERDNDRFGMVIGSPEYQALYGPDAPSGFKVRSLAKTKVQNWQTGWKIATSFGGLGTGERADRVLIDDPHNVKSAESDATRNETVRVFRESLQSRLNDMDKSAIIVIMQRVHESDVSGCIISQQVRGYDHLMIPMEFDPGRRCTTSIGWTDPRKVEGELAWPERFSANVVAAMKIDLGDFAYAAQAQQTPVPRGGGIIKRDSWQPYLEKTYPPFEYVVASLDTAYTEKESNDPCALTVWGFYREPKQRLPRVVLVHAWRKWLELRGNKHKIPLREPGESDADYVMRSSPAWGCVEWVIWSCRRWKVHHLLIEAKATGITVAQELSKELNATEAWSVQLIDPGRQDKSARLTSVQPVFSNGLVQVPMIPDAAGNPAYPAWAKMVVDEVSSYPKSAHKDLTDTTSQALIHLRRAGFLSFSDEQYAAMIEDMRHKPQLLPLYNV